ncbi:Vegetative incompatibility protein HET-E-1 [Colletotrichum spinosum]|uniref:Vegetative incompatibility protein HET-E-1 n=1 Tax=Colletotrichum spinosum TaxID=1347390 RepID=A0A4R8Q5I4_9PEZI|nr:Vegetative incompatibility protein HET-E-1 [Colletotrichum spinosum]
MRLLSTKNLTLHLFFDDAIPKYTILSHTWGKEEVTHQEMLNPTRAIQEKAGYEKIRRCAEISYDEGYEYTWIDTCCIDKTSSAELSESINSMFAWYRKAAYCLVYLEDFHGDHFKDLTGDIRWFQRGWTVQELIAPVLVVFYSASWGVIEEAHLFTKKLEKLTSIDQSVLRKSSSIDEISIAKKMSWFANRTTTRVEDMAYSMLGIMGINMPLIYGEGEVAFRRLQEEIIRNSEDASILLWKGTTEAAFDFRGPLARSPKEFSFANAPQAPDASFDEPFAMTNKGLALKADLISIIVSATDRERRETE